MSFNHCLLSFAAAAASIQHGLTDLLMIIPFPVMMNEHERITFYQTALAIGVISTELQYAKASQNYFALGRRRNGESLLENG